MWKAFYALAILRAIDISFWLYFGFIIYSLSIILTLKCSCGGIFGILSTYANLASFSLVFNFLTEKWSLLTMYFILREWTELSNLHRSVLLYVDMRRYLVKFLNNSSLEIFRYDSGCWNDVRVLSIIFKGCTIFAYKSTLVRMLHRWWLLNCDTFSGYDLYFTNLCITLQWSNARFEGALFQLQLLDDIIRLDFCIIFQINAPRRRRRSKLLISCQRYSVISVHLHRIGIICIIVQHRIHSIRNTVSLTSQARICLKATIASLY